MSEYDPHQAERSDAETEKARLDNERKGEVGDMIWLMNGKRGRRIVRRLLEQAGVFQLSFAGEATHQTAFNEGRRNQGLQLLSIIAANCPEQYSLLLKERSDNVD